MAQYVVDVPSVTETIKLKRPGREEEQFTADIRVRDTDEQDALSKKQEKAFKAWRAEEEAARKEGREPDEKKKPKPYAHVREDVLELGGFVDKDKKELTMTKAMIDKQMKDPYVLMALVRAWNRVQQGVQELTAKN